MFRSAVAQGSSSPPPGAETPALWSVASRAADGTLTTVIVCADTAIRQAFERATPEVGGQPCQPAGRGPVQDGRSFATRCRIGPQLFDVHSFSTGDLNADFEVSTVFETDAPAVPKTLRYETKLHFRKLASTCPQGWTVGDAGAPGADQVSNSLTGIAHKLPAAVPAPKPGA
jgi:hypothetical protein